MFVTDSSSPSKKQSDKEERGVEQKPFKASFSLFDSKEEIWVIWALGDLGCGGIEIMWLPLEIRFNDGLCLPGLCFLCESESEPGLH